MINFSDVRRESTPAFVFFARQLRTFLEYALKECQITGWQIMTRREVQPYLPEGFVIPEVRISPGTPRVEKHVLVFVSNFNQNDMLRKLEEIQCDQDIIDWQNAGGERLMQACLRDEKWVKDPPPFYPFTVHVREENKAQIPGVWRGEKPTFWFFPKEYIPVLEWYLENHGTTGWQIAANPEDIRVFLPERGYPGETVAFISYFNLEDMRRKLDEILSSEDYIAWQRRSAAHAAAMREYAQNWRSDPPPFPDAISQKQT